MKYILIILFVVAFIFSHVFRVIVENPIQSIKYFFKDIPLYFKYKKWRNCRTGTIVCYAGLFGKGKTLSAVHKVVSIYKRYNNKRIYDYERKMWVVQKIHIISNVTLNIPYEKFISLAQIVSIADRYAKIDKENDTLTIHIVFGDEFSVQLNSRSFKSNIDPLFLNTLLTCRHHHISLIYTAQRFNHVDALLRQVTSDVVICDKVWRAMIHRVYDAYELENASNPLDVRSKKILGWFVRDEDYNAYDTLACVENLAKSCASGDMLSETEILALQQNSASDPESNINPSRKFIKRMKKVRK